MRKDPVRKVTVEIFGQKYTLKGEASEAYMKEVAHYVDEKMRELSAKNPSLDTTKTAVLTAVNLADEYFKLQQEYEDLIKLIEAETRGKQT
ncbi:cell division protein ZapA [Caldalkalibacillus uzonensis]|uniref:Cell division protein ZapA n=1 Tax=Caldalkalibacillus uzonensis TaxID=353224 RepID=A0ABU0CTW9_9BACI|nr:cell division protein ZapA [Caldalkalibacillus uzonensis]MDQ0339864.1 cell division protein ZapA [Caldalkalibacillus uzonensis]